MSQETPILISQPIYKPMQLQNIEDFEREQDALDAERARKAKLTHPLPKRAKKSIDVTALAAEQHARDEIGEVNWVGRLLEYRNAHPVADPAAHPGEPPGNNFRPATIETGITRFTCTVVIVESPEKFGDHVSFGNKKDAKKYAAKKAIDWLIANNYMPSDGSVKFPKPPTPVQVAQPRKPKSVSPSEPSIPTDGTPTTKYTSKVPGLCTKLGFPPPRYEITRANAADHSFWNGYANFSDPRIEGRVGRVFNVWGKTNAKEQCAEIVYSFLKDIERQRGEEFGSDDRKRKRSSVSPDDGKDVEQSKESEGGTGCEIDTHAQIKKEDKVSEDQLKDEGY